MFGEALGFFLLLVCALSGIFFCLVLGFFLVSDTNELIGLLCILPKISKTSSSIEVAQITKTENTRLLCFFSTRNMETKSSSGLNTPQKSSYNGRLSRTLKTSSSPSQNEVFKKGTCMFMSVCGKMKPLTRRASVCVPRPLVHISITE